MECSIKIANCRLHIAKCYLMKQEVWEFVLTFERNKFCPNCDEEESSQVRVKAK